MCILSILGLLKNAKFLPHYPLKNDVINISAFVIFPTCLDHKHYFTCKKKPRALLSIPQLCLHGLLSLVYSLFSYMIFQSPVYLHVNMYSQYVLIKTERKKGKDF